MDPHLTAIQHLVPAGMRATLFPMLAFKDVYVEDGA
jgi:hypothetical protein